MTIGLLVLMKMLMSKVLTFGLSIAMFVSSVSSTSTEIETAVAVLRSNGISACYWDADLAAVDDDVNWIQNALPHCSELTSSSERRFLQEEEEEEVNVWFNIVGAAVCVCLAALAAGLTLGLLGLDPLMLLIKERAAIDEEEREIAKKLLPIVHQHHRLLVTLLLMNAVANEALPIFLESLVPPSVAILVSVTLVLFFGEIIPSAIFTGPNQMKIAFFLSPFVKFIMFILAPMAVPIAKLLDYLLHDDDSHGASYNRGELSALIRIQYEERLAYKRRRRGQKAAVFGANDVVSASLRHANVTEEALRSTIRCIEHQSTSDTPGGGRPSLQRSPSIHIDEVTMVEGALQMKTKVALDVFTPLRRVFSLPYDTCLNEKILVEIYASGHSRIPVYRQSDNPKDKTKILGVLITKQLIVINPKDARRLCTLPLYTPLCVSHAISLVDLLNKMQTGNSCQQGGHMALVCARPSVANEALLRKEAIPEAAGVMGVITLEDVLEMLLQEQIYDEMDKEERHAHKLVKLVITRWKRYVERKKANLPTTQDPTLLSVVAEAKAKSGIANERTSLLK